MDGVIYIIFICTVAPLLLMTAIQDGRSRRITLFTIIGICTCLFASEVNGLVYQQIHLRGMYYVTTTITPLTEELIKALPVLYYAIAFSQDRHTLLGISFAVGIGFGILENTYVLVSDLQGVSILWALIRGMGAALMHGICTAAVGWGVSFVRTRRKLFFTGTFALLTAAVVYHAVYNMLVQSDMPYIGFVLPLATYIPIVISVFRRNRRVDGQAAAQ